MDQDANEAQKDALSPKEGQPSEAATQKPSGEDETVTVFTKEDMQTFAEDFANKKHSALDKQLADQQKLINIGSMAGQELAEARARISELESKMEASQGEAAKLDPDMMDAVQAKRELNSLKGQMATKQKEQDWRELALSDAAEKVKQLELLEQVTAIASQYNVDAGDILSLKPETVDQMKLFAEKLAKVSGVTPTPPAGKPDSGLGAGASIDLSSMSAEQKIRYAIEHPKK